MLAIHVPVVFIIVGRLFYTFPFSLTAILSSFFSFFIGQFVGALVYKHLSI